MANTYTVTASNSTTYTVTVTQGVNVGSITGASAVTSPAGTEVMPVVTTGNVLKKLTLTNLKTWINSAVSSAWDSLTGTASKVPFNTAPSVIPAAVGSAYWNEAYETLELVQDADGNSLTVGLEIKIPVRNVSGVSITDGLAVYVAGEASSRASVALASVSDATHIASTIGVASQTIASPGNGKVTTQGEVHNLDTSALTAGQPIYLQENGTYNHTPSAIRIGWVLDSSNGNGKIYVSVARMKWLSADISDATATPDAGKVAKWGSSQDGTVDSVGQAPRSLYFYSSGSDISSPGDAGTLGNWWMDSAHTIQATSLPNINDTVYVIDGGASGTLHVHEARVSSTGTVISGFGIGSVITCDRAYADGTLQISGFDTCTINGDVHLTEGTISACTVNGDVYNDGGIIDSCTINGTTNGQVPASGGLSGIASGRSVILTGTKAQARAELGSGAVGDSIFQAATVAAARLLLQSQALTPSATVSVTSNATLENVAGMSFTAQANATYIVVMLAQLDVGAGGFVVNCLLPSIPSGYVISSAGFGFRVNGDATPNALRRDGTTNGFVMGIRTSAQTGPAFAIAMLPVGDTGGTAYFQFAQQNSNAAASSLLSSTKAYIIQV